MVGYGRVVAAMEKQNQFSGLSGTTQKVLEAAVRTVGINVQASAKWGKWRFECVSGYAIRISKIPWWWWLPVLGQRRLLSKGSVSESAGSAGRKFEQNLCFRCTLPTTVPIYFQDHPAEAAIPEIELLLGPRQAWAVEVIVLLALNFSLCCNDFGSCVFFVR